MRLRSVVVFFPRSQERGLIEAWRAKCCGNRCHPFRVRKNAASLKPADYDAVKAVLAAFRVRKNAASLKLLPPHRTNRGHAAFRVRKNAASLKPCHSVVFMTKLHPFRVRKNAASLKRHSGRVGDWCHGVFPRSQERGLIEAGISSTDGRGALSRFPRSQERGLIEA